MPSHRNLRVAEAIREVVSSAILFELADPRVKGVTVLGAEVTGDLRHATVSVSVMGSEAEQALAMRALLKRRYKLEAAPGRMSVLEATVYGICHEDAPREQANQALSRFKDDFFDWNEVRVSSVEEIQEVLAGLSRPEERAYRIRRF